MARTNQHPMGSDDETPVFVISVAAQLAGMHAQTLRQYDRIGLVSPSRTQGGGRRYSGRDVSLLREVQRLSQEGVSLAGIQRILDLEDQVEALQSRVAELVAELDLAQWLFINPELTVHVHRLPEGEWICMDARTTISPGGAGLAESVLSDLRGPVARGAQSLLVRRR